MKTLLRAVLFFSVMMIQSGSSAQNPSELNESRTRLVNGLYSNDEHAFEEVSKLPLDQAVPMLSVYVDDASTNKERAIRARETLRKMPGFSDYMKQQILEKRSKGGGEYEMAEFRLLGAIGGDEAAAAAAPFLFVEDPPLVIADDFSAGPIYSLAFAALVGMHLPDAPKGELEEWKAWADKKGYRDRKIPPLMTLQQKGVPPGAIARSEAILASARGSQTVVTTPASNHVQCQTPAPTDLSPASLKRATPGTSPQIPAATVEPKASVWRWIVGIAAATVIALLVWKRRV